MIPLSQHILLLTSPLGTSRRTLTVTQFRGMAEGDELDDLEERVARLLRDGELLKDYLDRGKKLKCCPLVVTEEGYPALVQERLGYDAPGSLWALGDITFLQRPAVSLVGSRDLLPENREFARQVGRLAAGMGLVLVSGNARGADKEAQDECLAHGGQVICVVADRLKDCKPDPDILYLSEDGYDLRFSTQRALSRNRIIHALGKVTFVAQAELGQGGSWNGTMKNLRSHYSPVYCFQDDREATEEFVFRGATPITTDDIGRVLYEQSR